jgi:hypothetical protein
MPPRSSNAAPHVGRVVNVFSRLLWDFIRAIHQLLPEILEKKRQHQRVSDQTRQWLVDRFDLIIRSYLFLLLSYYLFQLIAKH